MEVTMPAVCVAVSERLWVQVQCCVHGSETDDQGFNWCFMGDVARVGSNQSQTRDVGMKMIELEVTTWRVWMSGERGAVGSAHSTEPKE